MSETHAWSRDRLRLTLPNDFEALPVAAAFARAAASRYAYDDSALNQWEMVAEEAAANVVQHAYEPAERACFDIECHYQSDGMELLIRDRGIPFDPGKIAVFDPDAEERQASAGLGWHLIHEMTDRQQYDQLGAQGKELRLFKRAPAALKIPETIQSSAPLELKSAEGVIFRSMQADEAIEVVRLLYQAYRYSYINDQIYRPDYIASMNQAGKLRSYVAVLPDGSVIAHNALIFYEERPTVCEVGAAVASPAYRGQGVFDELGKMMFEAILEGGYAAAFAGTVTAHVSSQKAARRAGWIECGLMLAAQPAEVAFSKIKTDRNGERGTILYMAIKAAERPAPTLYLPSRHADFLQGILARIGLAFVAGRGVEPTSETSDLSITVRSDIGCGRITVLRIGSLFGDDIRTALRRFKRAKIQVGQLFLNLTDPSAPWAVEVLEGLDWFVTGLLPGGTLQGDALLMNWFNGHVVDYDKIRLAGPQARAMLDYVQRLDPNER